MALEVATTIQGLVSTNPVAGDPVSQGDDHLRLIKTVLKATPFIVDRAYVEYTANASLTTAIPFDDTIPQNTEGTQILSVSLTPKSVTNIVRLRFTGQVSAGSAPVPVAAAIFSSASANALVATFTSLPVIDYGHTIACEIEYVPATTSAVTFTVRVGSSTGAAVRLNGNTSGRFFGGSSRSTLTVEEIQA